MAFFLNRMIFIKDMFYFLWGKNWNFVYNLDKRQSSPTKKSVRIRNALRPANSITVLRGFPPSYSKRSVGIRKPRRIACFSCRRSQRDKHYVIKLPSKRKNQPKFWTSVLYGIHVFPKTHFPSRYSRHCPTLDSQPTLNRRTSGHCLGTFRAVNFWLLQ